MSYYQPPMGPYPPTPYMAAPMTAYPPATYPFSPYQPYPASMPSPYGPMPPNYSSPYPPTYPYSLHPSFPQPYPAPYYQPQHPHPQHPHPQQSAQPQGHHTPQQPPQQYAHTPHYPSSSVYPQPGTPAGVSAPAPAAVAVSSTALQVDSQGLPMVPGDPPVQVAQTYRVEEKVASVTRDSFTVRDQQGALAYKVDGQIASLHERKVMKDAHGQALLKLREARLKFKDQITIFNTANVALLTLQKTAAIQVRSKRVHGFLGGHPSGTPVVIITGNHNNTHFRVANAQNEEIADIRRKKYSMKNMLTDQDTYEVTIQKGSPALVCFITVALDEIYED